MQYTYKVYDFFKILFHKLMENVKKSFFSDLGIPKHFGY